ncbi:MAG: hypothetical protein A2X94_14520 [Bdellovibrionales bacterium GWB1_55_8]|nr:MAG: hypothetical protein A2X94_14520 [Bdellovibrionales bacterium GWB1_55_8]
MQMKSMRLKKLSRLLVILCLSAFLAALSGTPTVMAQVSPRKKSTTPPIPAKPSAPAPFAPPRPVEPFRCERYVLYRGQQIPCDSIVRQDAERLRPIIEDVPAAVLELNKYQKNRRDIRKAAYFGTAGIVLATAAFFISQQYHDSASELQQQGDTSGAQAQSSKSDIFKALTWGGLALTGGTIVFGISLLRTNELHLGNAVREFNDARPETPIELQFTTEIRF